MHHVHAISILDITLRIIIRRLDFLLYLSTVKDMHWNPWLVSDLSWDFGYLPYYLDSLYHLTKYHVLPIQMLALLECNEEL